MKDGVSDATLLEYRSKVMITKVIMKGQVLTEWMRNISLLCVVLKQEFEEKCKVFFRFFYIIRPIKILDFSDTVQNCQKSDTYVLLAGGLCCITCFYVGSASCICFLTCQLGGSSTVLSYLTARRLFYYCFPTWQFWCKFLPDGKALLQLLCYLTVRSLLFFESNFPMNPQVCLFSC